MAYNPVDHRDQTYYQNPGPYIQPLGNLELQSVAPSFTSYKGSFISQDAIPNDAASDHQHLLQGPNQSSQSAPWKTGFWRRFPVLAILALLGVLASTFASIAILVTSHNKPLFHWGMGIAPSVFLAIASVIGNALTAYALSCGLEITFWRNALHGRTLTELNQNWLNGHSLYSALLQGYRRGGRITSLACVLSVLALLRGPLFQRASAIHSDVGFGTSGSLHLAIAQKFPPDYTGISVQTRASTRAIARLTPVFADVMQDYSLRRNISMSYEGCGNSCEAVVRGFGFNTTCWFTEYTQEVPVLPVPDQPIFVSSTSLYPIGAKAQIATFYEDVGMQFNVTYRTSHSYGEVNDKGKKVQGMITNLKSHICNITGGLVEYKVRLSRQTISLASNRSEDRFLERQVMRGPGSYHGSTIGGFEYAASYLFSSSAVFQFRGAIAATVLQGSLANEMIRGNISESRNEKFDDPMESMLEKMREIAFRTAVRAARDETLNLNETDAAQQVTYKGSATHSIYVTDFRYMIGAAALSIASVLATALCFWGWWQLGRAVSLSPLEIAKAFDAPLLSQVGSNVDLSKNKNLGYVAGMRLQYGVRADDQAYSTQYAGGPMEHQRRRLVIGQAGYVGKPTAGDHYGN